VKIPFFKHSWEIDSSGSWLNKHIKHALTPYIITLSTMCCWSLVLQLSLMRSNVTILQFLMESWLCQPKSKSAAVGLTSVFIHALPMGDAALAPEFALVAAIGDLASTPVSLSRAQLALWNKFWFSVEHDETPFP